MYTRSQLQNAKNKSRAILAVPRLHVSKRPETIAEAQVAPQTPKQQRLSALTLQGAPVPALWPVFLYFDCLRGVHQRRACVTMANDGPLAISGSAHRPAHGAHMSIHEPMWHVRLSWGRTKIFHLYVAECPVGLDILSTRKLRFEHHSNTFNTIIRMMTQCRA